MGKAAKFVLGAAAIIFTGGIAAIGLAIGGYAAAAAVVGTLTNYLAVGMALSGVSALLTNAPGRPRFEPDIEYDGTMAPRRIIYGTTKVSGLNVIPPLTSGTKNQMLHQVLAIAGHEINEITTVYFNETPITSFSAVSGTTSDGLVTVGKFANKAWVRRYLGTSTQTADVILRSSFTEWTSNHTGLGVAYIAIQYELDEKLYASGKPDVTCIVQGKKCYDPRLDSAPGANPTNASYIAFTSNPALCIADYLTDTALGLGEAAARIDWDLIVTAANVCDESVTIPSWSSPNSTTQSRYTCNVVLEATARFEENIQSLAAAMMGHCLYSGGKWRIYAGEWPASTSFALTADDIISYEIVTATPYNDRYNAVRGGYVDPDRNYQAQEFVPRFSTTYDTEDGERAYRDVVFDACTNEHEAQRNAIILMRMSRNRRIATLRCTMAAWKIRPFDIGTVTIADIGWSEEPVRCESWKFTPEGIVEIVVREASSGDWDDPAIADYGAKNEAPQPVAGGHTPDAPDNLTAQATIGAIIFNWKAASTHGSSTFYRLYSHTSSTPFSSATLVSNNIVGSNVTTSQSDTTTKYYWITAVDSVSGLESDPEPYTTGIAAAPGGLGDSVLLVGDVLVAVASQSSIYTLLDSNSGGTSSSVTVSVQADNTPVTYSWARTSGSTSITAVSSTAATTAFSVTGISDGATLEAVFRCTVTDAASPAGTTTVDVVVTFERQDAGLTMGIELVSSIYKYTPDASDWTPWVSATPYGGSGSYTFNWVKLSGDAKISGSFSQVDPTYGTARWQGTTLTDGALIGAIYRVTATDTSSPANTATADIQVEFERQSSFA